MNPETPETPGLPDTPEPAEPAAGQPSPRAQALARELLEVQARNALQLRWIRIALVLTVLCWGTALLLWLPGGGRAAFVAGVAPSGMVIALPAWLAVAGLVTAMTAATLFMARAMGSSLESIIERQHTPNPKGRRP